MTHDIKCWPPFFTLILDGLKPFEVRRNDRGYNTGDRLYIHEYKPVSQQYTGRIIIAEALFILDDATFGIQPGYCVIGLKVLNTVIPIDYGRTEPADALV